MSIAKKLQMIAENEQRVYEKGYEDGNGEWNSFWSDEGTRFTIPNNITSLKNGAFWDNQKLVWIDLPEGLTSIGEYAFNSCKELLLSSIPNGVTNIGQYAFEGCKKIAVSVLPPNLTEIEYACFYDCGEMTVNSIPASVISVGQYAFCRCTKITEITFKGKPNSIANGAFYNCYNLKTINVPWAEGAVANAPWGATNSTIVYNYNDAKTVFNLDDGTEWEFEEGMTWAEFIDSDYNTDNAFFHADVPIDVDINTIAGVGFGERYVHEGNSTVQSSSEISVGGYYYRA